MDSAPDTWPPPFSTTGDSATCFHPGSACFNGMAASAPGAALPSANKAGGGVILYVEASAGVSGDMLLQAFLNLGLPLSEVRNNLRRLGKISFSSSPIDWIGRVRSSALNPGLKSRLIRVITLLAQAEGAAHRRPWKEVIFHQLGRPDTLAALTGFCQGLAHFRIQSVYTSPVPLGRRHQDPQGAWKPVPGPATRWLLRRLPVDPRPDRFEWTTPTGAALLAAFASPRPAPPFELVRIGRGVGRNRSPQGKRALRLLLGWPLELG